MTEPATAEDRRWWLRLAPTLQWTWAVTYAQTAPHWYVVLGRTPGMERDDFIRVGRVIRTFGEAGRFYSMTNLYLFTEDRNTVTVTIHQEKKMGFSAVLTGVQTRTVSASATAEAVTPQPT